MATSSAEKLGPFQWKLSTVNGVRVRNYHTLTQVGARIYIFGGYYPESGLILDDIVVLHLLRDGFRLSNLPTADGIRPIKRNGHSTTLIEDKLYSFGGWTGGGVSRELCVFDLTLQTWTFPDTIGRGPALPNLHAAHYVEALDKIVCFGGGDGTTFVNDLVFLDAKNFRWIEAKTSGVTPEARTNHSSCISGSKLYVFGGWNTTQYFNDIHILHLSVRRAAWSSPKPAHPPSRRTAAAMAVLHGRVLLFGGHSNSISNELFVFDETRGSWRKCAAKQTGQNLEDSSVAMIGDPPACSAHKMIPIRSNLLLVYRGATWQAGNENRVFTVEQNLL